MSSALHLLRPYWLAALIPLVVLLVLLWRTGTGAAIWRKLVDAHLLPHLLSGEEGRPRRLPLILLALGWLLLVLALAGPVWEKLPQPVFETAAQRAILLDLSPSMNARDIAPSRLARARFEILDILKATSEGEVALLAFGPEPFVVSPLSGDAKTVAAQVPQLTSDLIPVPGPRRTELALKEAGDMLEQAHAANADIILVSDGVGDMAGALEQAHKLSRRGYRLSVLAVGTTNGAPVPGSQGGLAQNDDGSLQVARLQRDRLRELAKSGGGRYLEASVGDRDTRLLTSAGPKVSDELQKTTLSADQWREEGPWLILALLPLAALAFRRGWLLPVLAVVLILPAGPSQAFEWSDLWLRPDQQAARQLQSGDAKAAAQAFEDPAWRAAASYEAGDYAKALDEVSGLEGPEADFNRGNALARLGRLKDAVAAYQETLGQQPDHADAKHNLALVEKLLEQQEKQKDKQQQNQQQDERQQDQQGEKQQGGQQSQQPSSGQDKGQDQQDVSSGQEQNGGTQPSARQDQQRQDGGEQGSESNAQEAQGGQAGDQAQGAQPESAGAHDRPDASDFSQQALSQEGESLKPSDGDEQADAAALHGMAGKEQKDAQAEARAAAVESLSPEERERQQAMEAQLRRVPDDPAGLLRQRFLLQHLRREGRLP